MKLEPTEAQRKAMAEVGASGPTAGWSDRVNDWFPVVHRMIAAANSIPEGPPVGTIARRPDGEWIAVRRERHWGYRWLKGGGVLSGPPPNPRDADSWPVIYDPDEYHEGDNPRLERLMREPSVFDGDEDEVEELAKWLSIHIGTWPEDEWELRSKPNYYHDRAQQLLDFGYRKVSDPETGLHWFKPGEEPLVPRPDPGSKDAGDWIKAQVVHSGGSLWRRDGYMWRGVGHTGGRSPLPSLARPGVAVTVVIDDDGELVSDLSKLACIDGDVEELLAEHGLLPDPTAQQEPATTHPVSPESTNCVPKPRTPRVVNCLGVDEQGSRWRNRCGEVHEFRDGCWKYKDGRRWFPSSLSFPEYTEIVGPRVLPSLDCEDARDGTVWEEPEGWRFWFNGGWRTDNGLTGMDFELHEPGLLDLAPHRYTEVLPDVAS